MVKNSGGIYSKVPKNVVVDILVPSFFVVTLDDETDELEEASSAIEFAEEGESLCFTSSKASYLQ